MGNRPRISVTGLEPAVPDELEFTKNRTSSNARRICVNSLNLEFEVWFDKHYFSREHHGDESGKREGINYDVVKELIEDVAKHLIFYSLKVKNFSFVNFHQSHRPERVVITQLLDDELALNVITEYHYLSLNKYEVTIVTALKKDDFYFSDGQYQIKIDVDNTSTLYRSERGVVKIISEFEN